jgi:TonB family protein
VTNAFVQAAAPAGGAALPMLFPEPEQGKSILATGGLSTLLHLGILSLLFLFAALQPDLVEEIIEVRLLKEKPERPPAPARRVLAERRSLDFAPAVQAVQPQIVNPRVIATAAPAIHAERLEVDALKATAAPTQVKRSAINVDRVSAVTAVTGFQASKVEIDSNAGPAVRGPVRAVGPVGPSVGPRKVADTHGDTVGTGSLGITGGSSVRDGLVSARDVVGAPTGQVLVSVDTRVGDSDLAGPGGTGTGNRAGGFDTECAARPDVLVYVELVKDRVYERWHIAAGTPNLEVNLRFKIDVAGSATNVELISSLNALGAGAVDAMRAASPFPPMPDSARCLADKNLTMKFRILPGAS